MNPTQIKCPKCNSTFPLDQAISHELEESIKKKQQDEIEEIKKKLREEAALWKDKQESKIEDEKKKIVEAAQLEREKLAQETEEYKKKLQDSQNRELELLKRQEELEEKERNLELETKRKIAEERSKIQEEEQRRVKEEYQHAIAEKDKKLADALKANDELKYKLTQGSQQLQGEVLELELEQVLQTEFPLDEIAPVPKGMTGADVIQTVRDTNGRSCGVIIWESKKTKDWVNEWIPKLKADMRFAKADLAIIVSTQLPKDIHNFGPKDGIYVTNFENYLAIARVMRLKIIELCYAKMSVEGVKDKKEILWKYLTGNEFKQRVEAIVEAFSLLKNGIDKERQYFVKKWAQQEKLIDIVISQTIGMHGDLQGLMGASLPEIKSLEMDNFEFVETTQISITDDTATVVQTTMTEGIIES